MKVNKMSSLYRLGLTDHLVISLSLVVSLSVGIYFHFYGNKQISSRNFLLAGRNMSRLPVILSIVATHLSAILMLGAPAEIYRYGSQLMILMIGAVIGIVLAVYLLVPIYLKLGISTVYEYLEMRYGKLTRITVSGLFILQMMLYMSVVLYAPALALSAVTDLTTESSILIMGIVCIVYCTLGGLKAVLWTDAFQSILMYACLLIVFTVGILEVGGVEEVIHRAKEGNRWEFFNFNADLTTRYTVWNALFRGLSLGIGGYGVSQLEVQRLLSLNSIKSAQSALLWSILPTMIIVFMCYSMGLILYGVFYQCDPILNGERTGLSKHDQILINSWTILQLLLPDFIVTILSQISGLTGLCISGLFNGSLSSISSLLPYFIVTRLSQVPGLTGLCIAGLFSGSLSTISSAVNSISTVTVVDFIQSYCHCLKLKEKELVWTAKSLVILYGALCIGFTFLLSHIGSLTQMATVSLGVMEGPVTAVFLLGMMTIRTNGKGSTIGFLAGCIFSGWIGFGSTIRGYFYPMLPITDELCPDDTNVTLMNSESWPLFKDFTTDKINLTSHITSGLHLNTFYLYKISYMWIPTIGFFCSVCISYLASILIDWNREKQKIDNYLLCPMVKKWMLKDTNEEDEVNLAVKNKLILLEEKNQSRKSPSNCTLQK